jgi:AraC-like DNA-binding protein
MFDDLTTNHYGRCVKNNDWYLKSFGVNRIHYIHQGHLSIMLDNTRYDLQPGRIYLFPQNLKLELLLTEDTEVDHTFFDFFTLPAIRMDTLMEIDPKEHPVLENASRILFQLAEEHQTYPSMQRNEYSDLVESYLRNLLTLMDKKFRIPLITDDRINAALDYIHKHFSEELTLETLTEVTNLEKNYFIRLFNQTVNMTPYQYIKKYRFNVALSMMKQGCSMGETAVAIGYSDAVSFSHAFKKYFGKAPSEFSPRKGLKKDGF